MPRLSQAKAYKSNEKLHLKENKQLLEANVQKYINYKKSRSNSSSLTDS